MARPGAAPAGGQEAVRAERLATRSRLRRPAGSAVDGNSGTATAPSAFGAGTADQVRQPVGAKLDDGPPSRSRVQAALGRFERLGLADRSDGGWALADVE